MGGLVGCGEIRDTMQAERVLVPAGLAAHIQAARAGVVGTGPCPTLLTAAYPADAQCHASVGYDSGPPWCAGVRAIWALIPLSSRRWEEKRGKGSKSGKGGHVAHG